MKADERHSFSVFEYSFLVLFDKGKLKCRNGTLLALISGCFSGSVFVFLLFLMFKSTIMGQSC